MLRSLFSGVSGMDANQEWIDTIGNDISNINTTGFKSNEVQFEDLLGQTIAGATAPTTTVGGVDPTQVGLGVKVAGIEANMTQGTSEQTGNPLDLSIQGDGFFVAKSNGQNYYTRAGSLKLDANGDLVTPDGKLIQGWSANSQGVINTNAPLGNVVIPTGQQIAANATQNFTLGGNLNGQSGWTAPKGFSVSGAATPPVGTSTSVTVYAPNGAQQSLDLSMVENSSVSGGPTGSPAAASEWTVAGVVTDPGATPDYTSAPTFNLYFDASGNLLGYAPTGGSYTAGSSVPMKVNDETNGKSAGSATATYTMKVPSLTANASADTISVLSQDGNAPGTLQSYSIGNNGVIQGVFSNGQALNLGQIALASFANPDGLLRSGDTSFEETANSGLAQVGQANTGSFGAIQAGSLEASNVDLATEMTELIAAQNGFQANGSVISTANTLLQTLINLKP